MPDRPSSGTVTGALQILPSGLPMLLMAERQTTGGYPVAAIVITADLGHAAQLAPGDEVRFAPVSRAEALRALLEQDARARSTHERPSDRRTPSSRRCVRRHRRRRSSVTRRWPG